MRGPILIVDDDPDIRKLVTHCLQKEGYRVIGAEDVASALAKCEQELPQLMIVDLMLPDEDGETFINTFRSRWTEANVPVILLSASAERDQVAQRTEVQASLDKPFVISELIELISTYAP